MIYINARFLTQKLTGVQRYAIELCRELIKIHGRNNLKFVTPKNVILKKEADEFNAEIIGSHTGYVWEQIELPLYLKKKGNPALVNFCSLAPLLYKNNYVTFHDVTWVKFPKTHTWQFKLVYNFLTPRIGRKAKHIFTVSNFSKDEICDTYNLPRNKFSITYNAVDEKFHCKEDADLKNQDYIVAVSSIKENKNFPMVLESFNEYAKSNSNCMLYIIGDLKEKCFANVDMTEFLGAPNVVILGRVSDEDLIKYYSNAKAFIFPSLHEGFGIPALEAQACGCPVVSSNSSCMPEVLGDSAILCDPMDKYAFAKAFIDLDNNYALREEYIRKGFENVKRYSWRESAKIVLDAIINK